MLLYDSKASEALVRCEPSVLGQASFLSPTGLEVRVSVGSCEAQSPQAPCQLLWLSIFCPTDGDRGSCPGFLEMNKMKSTAQTGRWQSWLLQGLQTHSSPPSKSKGRHFTRSIHDHGSQGWPRESQRQTHNRSPLPSLTQLLVS